MWELLLYVSTKAIWLCLNVGFVGKKDEQVKLGTVWIWMCFQTFSFPSTIHSQVQYPATALRHSFRWKTLHQCQLLNSYFPLYITGMQEMNVCIPVTLKISKRRGVYGEWYCQLRWHSKSVSGSYIKIMSSQTSLGKDYSGSSIRSNNRLLEEIELFSKSLREVDDGRSREFWQI